MNQHTIILPFTPEPLQRLFDFNRKIEEKIFRGEDIEEDIKKFTNGSTEIPRGLRNYKIRKEE